MDIGLEKKAEGKLTGSLPFTLFDLLAQIKFIITKTVTTLPMLEIDYIIS